MQAAVLAPIARAPLDSHYLGFSLEKAKLATPYFSAENRGLVRLYRLLGPGLLRLGGNTVDLTSWEQNGEGQMIGIIAPSDLRRLAGFLQATGWQILYGINLGSNTPERAALEARTANAILHDHLYGFEIGNEPDGFYLNGARDPVHYGVPEYMEEWRTYRRAILGAVPNAVLSAPSGAYGLSGFADAFAGPEGRTIELLGIHYYRASGEDPGSTIPFMLSKDPNLDRTLALMQKIVQSGQIRGGYRFTEANSFWGGGAKHISNTFASALWSLDFLFETALRGCMGVNFHGGGRSPGYTPIADDDHNVVEVRPEFYGLCLFSLAAKGRLLGTQVTAGGINFSVYAVRGDDGSLRVVLLNKEESTSASVHLELGQPVQKAAYHTLQAPALASTNGILLADSPIDVDGQWKPAPPQALSPVFGTSLVVDVPAASAMVLYAD
ncbi:MAG: glycosyl hydrolase family 79 C-terminal domain-containing protein [Burkholderiaceae bacterium]